MDDLGFNPAEVSVWLSSAQDTPFVLVRVETGTVATWPNSLAAVLRRCYVTDGALSTNAQRLSVEQSEIIAAKLPDPGAVMSGDFGEIVAYLYHVARLHPTEAIGVKKWRLKQDRRMATPHSDVIHFVVPEWPISTANDAVICSEVKAKATAGASEPVLEAIRDSKKDQTSRLARTLAWLRERAMTEDLGDVQLALLDRFIKTPDHPLAQRQFRAVAVICDSVAAAEIQAMPLPLPSDIEVVVIVVPQLKATYTSVFDAALRSAG